MDGIAYTSSFTERLRSAFPDVRFPRLANTDSIPPKTRPTQQPINTLLEDALNCYYKAVSSEGNESMPPQKEGIEIAVEARRRTLVEAPGRISEYLHYNEKQIRTLALQLASQDLACEEKIAFAENLLGSDIPGDHIGSKHSRVCSARFWRRALKVRIVRAREHFFLRLALIGSRGENYVSDAHVAVRTVQLARQTEWLQQSTIKPLNAGSDFEALPLAKFAKTPKQRFAKLYTFIKAIETLSVSAGLRSAMITVTLEAEWHPNPSHGETSWNGASPLEAHKSFCHRWQAVLRDLHRRGMRLSGLRVAEPHKDACPHYHIWANYQPEHEQLILQTIMKYFPCKLKIRGDEYELDNFGAFGKDIIFDDLPSLLNGRFRKPRYNKEGAQVEVSLINRSLSSGASYAMKYLLKTVDGEEGITTDRGGSDKGISSESMEAREEQKRIVKRVDAFRFVWGIHQGQLFGIAKCLTVWDELRRLTTRPDNFLLRELWALARGSDKEGRISSNAGICGNAVEFLKLLGGLDAARKSNERETPNVKLGRLVETGLNCFGDVIQRTKGLRLLQKRIIKRHVVSTDKKTGQKKTHIVQRSETTVLAELITKIHAWIVVRAPRPNNSFAHFAERRSRKNNASPDGLRKYALT